MPAGSFNGSPLISSCEAGVCVVQERVKKSDRKEVIESVWPLRSGIGYFVVQSIS